MIHKTKIIATVGPACDQPEQLLALVHAGVNVFRLNFSHGTHESHAAIIQRIRQINKEQQIHTAILADLQGPKLRIGDMRHGSMDLKPGQVITLSDKPCAGTEDDLYISYPRFHKDVNLGEEVMMDDGKIIGKIIGLTDDERVKVKISTGGILLPNKGVNLPDTTISLPSLTEKDLEDLNFIVEQKVDWIALSFVRHPDDIKNLRSILIEKQSAAKIIAKIEKPEAVTHLTEIIRTTDAVMVARGDLGVELPVEKVPMLQKDIIRKCIHRAKPVIVATQMMESMIERARPNRSEVTDVANAVMEGADAVMLSGETAMGRHPALVVRTMVDIITEVEKEKTVYNHNLVPQSHSPSFLSDALCYNACKIAEDVNADALIGMTQSGYTGFMLSSYRPHSPLFVFTQTKSLISQLSLSWGVHAILYDKNENLDQIIFDQINILKEKGFLKSGDVVINTGSMPIQQGLPTNMLKITRVE